MNRLLLAAASVVGLPLALVLVVEFFPPAGSLPSAVVEALTHETPEAKIGVYVHAIAKGSEIAALAAWELPDWELAEGRSGRLFERRRQVTGDLLAAGIRPRHRIVAMEWWRTCCEPGVITDPHSAGGARVDVELQDRNGKLTIYRFDVFTRGGAYWGAAMGYPPRDWSLRDVYPSVQEPLFWPWTKAWAIISPDLLAELRYLSTSDFQSQCQRAFFSSLSCLHD